MPQGSTERISRSSGPVSSSRRLITICIPIFNEEANIPALIRRLGDLAKQHVERYDFEFLFTDDASTDSSYELLTQEAKNDYRIRVLRLSRNFGFQRNVLTNFLNARGEAAVEIDADLQDPPELIGEFLRLWEAGYKVVYGIRAQRHEGRVITALRTSAYHIIQRISEIPVPINAGDFRLIDRIIIEHLRSQTDLNPYLRGTIAALGYPQIGVQYDRPSRFDGYSKFPILKLIKLGMDGITNQSIRPLHYITMIGVILSLLTTVLTVAYLGTWFFGIGTTVRGFTTVVLLQLFAIAMNALFLGIMGEYIGRIFNNVRGHPIGVVEKKIESGVESPYLPYETVMPVIDERAKVRQ
jgi:dolichol-phosphate mannosyltransferase